MRAADADRERVVGVLQDAFAQGRITVDEFHERSDQAYAAKTLSDLVPLTADLPAQDLAAGPVPAGRAVEGSRFGSGSWSPTTLGRTSEERRHQLKAIWSSWITVTVFTTLLWLLCGEGFFWPVYPIAFLGAGAALRTFGISSHGTGHNGRRGPHDHHDHHNRHRELDS